jgi:hypothetical protein
MVEHLLYPALPIQSSMEHRTHSCEAGAIRLPVSSCTATRCGGSGTPPADPQKPSSGPLVDGLCRILHLSFGENPYGITYVNRPVEHFLPGRIETLKALKGYQDAPNRARAPEIEPVRETQSQVML